MPTALATLYCTSADVDACLSSVGADERLNDSGGPGGTPTAGEEAYLTTQAVNYATAQINAYALGYYSAAELAKSWLVNLWAVVFAVRWLSMRRANPAPSGVEEQYKEAVEQLKEIQNGRLSLNDVDLREPAWPYWSNIRVDPRFKVLQSRVVAKTSEDTPMDYSQKKDHAANVLVEPNF